MDVDRDLAARKLPELLPLEREWFLHLAEDSEVPRREVCLRHRSRMQHRPLLGQVLARRETRGVETALDQLLLGLRPEQGHASLD